MIIIPAIDIKEGRCVRLIQGDMDRETVYASDPVAQAKKWEQAGAKIIHIVDLDGAIGGKPANSALVAKICKAVKCEVELGGGIRSRSIADEYFAAGVAKIVLGTMLIKDHKEAGTIINAYPDRVLAGIDSKNGMIAVEGWKEMSTMTAAMFAQQLTLLYMDLGGIVFTDISRDGMMQGVNVKEITTMAALSGEKLIASGGVSNMADLEILSKIPGVCGAIIGKALYTGAINLEEAIEKFQKGRG